MNHLNCPINTSLADLPRMPLPTSGYENLADFLAENGVRVFASLPCYSEANVTKQRGAGVFERSIAGLRQLNKVGYGQPGTGLVLCLVYNPGGAFLPPDQVCVI